MQLSKMLQRVKCRKQYFKMIFNALYWLIRITENILTQYLIINYLLIGWLKRVQTDISKFQFYPLP